MCNQSRKIVLMNLFDQGVLRCNKDVFEQTRLSRRDVSEPATHFEELFVIMETLLSSGDGMMRFGKGRS